MTKHYRQLWEEANGPIPKDKFNRTFEIHHINGDHNDNRLENLQCLSISDHFNVHYNQSDFLACTNIAYRMGLSGKHIKDLASLGGKEARDKGLGFHAISKEEKKKNSSKGGRAVKGYVWWTNGVENTKAIDCPGLGWQRGRTKTKKKLGFEKGKKLGVFWNNGKENKRAIDCPGSEWIRGKLLTEEQRERRSKIASEPCSEETKKKMSISAKKFHKEHPDANKGRTPWNKGIKLSKEQKKKMGKLKGRTWKTINGKRIWSDKPK